MKTLILAMAVAFASMTANAASDLACLPAYDKAIAKEKNARAKKQLEEARQYLFEAYDDCDWESMEKMVLDIRKTLSMPRWPREGAEDRLNCELSNITTRAHLVSKMFCLPGEPLWNLDQIKKYLVETVKSKLACESYAKLISNPEAENSCDCENPYLNLERCSRD